GMTVNDTAAMGDDALTIFDEFNPQFQLLMKSVNTNALFGKDK
ncbi:sugar kinase, partial [Klebsiella quasipneumoniae]|nr:sugar kinase [Klebsiella quasipneumoniae]